MSSIGRIIREGINEMENKTIKQYETEMYKALLDFKTRTDPMWKKHEAYRGLLHEGDYDDNIAFPIRRMEARFEEVIDPGRYKDSETILSFKRGCIHYLDNGSKTTFSEKMLDYLEQHLMIECEAITPQETKRIAEQRLYLLDVISRETRRFRYGIQPEPPIGSHLTEFLSIYQHIDKKILDSEFLVDKGPFDSWDHLFATFFDELREKGGLYNPSSGSRCLTQQLLLASNFNHEHLGWYDSYFSSYLTYLTYYAGFCSDALFDGSGLERYNKNIAARVSKISVYTQKYLDDALASAWPAIHNGILNENIFRLTSKPGNLSEQINEVINKTHNILVKTGFLNYSYDILIVKPETKKYDIYYDGLETSCSQGERASGFDTVISRKPVVNTTHVDLYNDQVKRNEYAKKLGAIIQREIKTISNDNLPAIGHALKEKFKQEMSTTDAFQCWAIVREKKTGLIHRCPKVQSWVSPNSTIFNTSYKNDAHVIKACQEFQFYFFM